MFLLHICILKHYDRAIHTKHNHEIKVWRAIVKFLPTRKKEWKNKKNVDKFSKKRKPWPETHFYSVAAASAQQTSITDLISTRSHSTSSGMNELFSLPVLLVLPLELLYSRDFGVCYSLSIFLTVEIRQFEFHIRVSY